MQISKSFSLCMLFSLGTVYLFLIRRLYNAAGDGIRSRENFRKKHTSSLDILTLKRVPRGYYKGKNCKPTGFHTRKGLNSLFSPQLEQIFCSFIRISMFEFFLNLVLNYLQICGTLDACKKLKPKTAHCPRHLPPLFYSEVKSLCSHDI